MRLGARHLLAALLVAATACLPLAARTKSNKKNLPYGGDAPTREWRHGPVWYILTTEEERAYKRLEDDQDRRAFIEAFWARRDPTPWTLHNELREEFWKRVEAADSLFAKGVKPGWKTERGKLYVLFGPPNNFETYSRFRGKRRDFAWRYEAEDVPRELIEVVQVTLNPPLNAIGANQDTVLRPPHSPSFEEFLSRSLEERLRAGDLAKLMRLPITTHQLDEIVTTSEFYNSLPLQASYDFYRGDSRTTFATLTLSVPARMLPLAPAGKETDESIMLYAKMVGQREPAMTYSFSSRLEASATDDIGKVFDDGQLVFQAKGDLLPGLYRFYVGLEVSQGDQVSFFRDAVLVPALDASDLLLSSITLISRFERAPEGYDDRKIPFVLGPHKVVPRPGHVFRNGQTLGVYYQIYNTRLAPDGGQVDLEIKYQFRMKDHDRMVRIGTPFTMKHQHETVQRWSFPLSQWPEAEYRLDVTVKDLVSGQVTTGEAFFTIDPE
ncbi:MAG: GWxTD domain-containing protein [Acidobacteriota bacterium]